MKNNTNSKITENITHIASLPPGVSNRDSELDEVVVVVDTFVVPEEPVGLQEI